MNSIDLGGAKPTIVRNPEFRYSSGRLFLDIASSVCIVLVEKTIKLTILVQTITELSMEILY